MLLSPRPILNRMCEQNDIIVYRPTEKQIYICIHSKWAKIHFRHTQLFFINLEFI